ncbi:response regulator [Desulfogranum mediterraneum]|uniref:response regulator n=1 Tax=Desulfogranum mediterraneum TaxID=160661 RepID=UPI0004189CE2|nr:response regulator [Desulfogranum mediterraneum]
MRILVIDDDQQMRTLIRQVVEWAGDEVVEAEDGRAGMQQQRLHRADLVITDLIMPEQEGLETITSLKKEFPDTKIIAISGGGRIGPEAYLPAAKELGADRIFTKPFDVKELADTIKELLANEE